jgi:hypothetical protein
MGTGGARYGAGRPGWRRKCEHTLPLDIRRLHRKGLLRTGAVFGWRWSSDDEPRGNIGIAVSDSSACLSYIWTPGDERREMRYDVRIDRTPCYFGGLRSWFRCPRCSRRCAVLYGLSRRDGYFGCRRCLHLAYTSESECPLDRLWRKQRKLEARLSWLGGEVPERPKWMRQRTFERILSEIDLVEEAKDLNFMASFAPLCKRLGIDPEDVVK